MFCGAIISNWRLLMLSCVQYRLLLFCHSLTVRSVISNSTAWIALILLFCHCQASDYMMCCPAAGHLSLICLLAIVRYRTLLRAVLAQNYLLRLRACRCDAMIEQTCMSFLSSLGLRFVSYDKSCMKQALAIKLAVFPVWESSLYLYECQYLLC